MPNKRLLALVAVVIFLTALLSGCGSDDSTTFRYDISSEPKNLDPQVSADPVSLLIIQNTFEGLMTHDKDGNLINGVASSYTVSDDKLTYTFTLDENACWVLNNKKQDPVTAHDFVFAFQRLFDKYTGSPYIKQFLCLKNAADIMAGKQPKEALGVYATSATQLTVELEYPSDGFLELTTTTPAMPCNQQFFTQTKGKYGMDNKNIVTNGPFSFYSWKQGKSLVLSKNEYYTHAADVSPEVVGLYPGKSDTEVLKRFLNGTTDVMSVSGEKIESLVQQGYGYAQFQDTTWALVFNTNDKVCSNRNIRLGLASAFTGTAYQNQLPIWLKNAGGYVPPVVTFGGQPFRKAAGLNILLPYLPENALASFQLGTSELSTYEPSITILCPDTEPFSFLMQFTQQTWQRDLSAFVSLKRMPLEDIQTAMKSGKFQAALVPFKPDSDSAYDMLSAFTSDSPKNIIGYADVDYNSLIALASSSPEKQAGDYLKQAEQKLINDAVLIPFAYQTSFYALSKRSKDIVITPFGGRLLFKYAQKVKKK
ncbi:oligopeptide transport system substrate-binding protein [Acetanaerobacterium elongatum]|uniref:Oligopeptide transport system substrate-binding protein n=1 Tax=Acetanaerobacterium elongatum TaxID=258515 RepID=A0A1H0EP46_9FIRM|nr:oligopeptide transport system substrate-binding protein [Acetanaerobacterium elongatum]